MKFCNNCGNELDDDMPLCPMCGAKSEPFNTPHKPRKIMLIFSIYFCILAIVFTAISILDDPKLILATVFFSITAFMFLILAKSPKSSSYLFGKRRGLKKYIFVIICLALSSMSAITYTQINTENGSANQTPAEGSRFASPKNTAENIGEDVNSPETAIVTLDDIQKWYEEQIPEVGQSLIEYSQSVSGISNINITESKFRFGEEFGWYDCHYTINFTCNINYENCTGEARAFMKYQDSAPTWFHFEIFRDSDWTTITEYYDDTYDQIIEDYYKELTSQYN